MKPDGDSVGSGVKFAAVRLIDLLAAVRDARSRGPATSACTRGTDRDRDGSSDMGLDIRCADVDAGDRWQTVVEQPSRLRRLCSKVNVPNVLF